MKNRKLNNDDFPLESTKYIKMFIQMWYFVYDVVWADLKPGIWWISLKRPLCCVIDLHMRFLGNLGKKVLLFKIFVWINSHRWCSQISRVFNLMHWVENNIVQCVEIGLYIIRPVHPLHWRVFKRYLILNS